MVKPITAYAIVKKKSPRLNLGDLYQHTDVKVEKDELIIKVTITAKCNTK